jgi:hypothetical protein
MRNCLPVFQSAFSFCTIVLLSTSSKVGMGIFDNLSIIPFSSRRECGLFLCEKSGYLGASPDGIVTSKIDTCRPWVLEIKCPYKWRFKTIRDACRDRNFFCEIDSENEIQLKKSHT